MANAPARPIPTMDEFRTLLRRHGLKATRQRIAVHDVMMVLVHASAEMVKEELSERGAKVTTSSVYNILSQLADCRIYGRRMSGANKMFFDVISGRHIHLYDRENHTWRDLVDEDLDALVNTHLKRRKFKGFTVEDIDIQLIARPTKKNKIL
ncbi:MAG: transcriptional repressor [Bacteroidales bacterium]|nr:transcriptional repressor [Bacteroidales bacterium]